MPGSEFTESEIAEVVGKYRTLAPRSPGVLEGILDMHATYEGSAITDSFNVRITAPNPHSKLLPALYEIGGRTSAIAGSYGIADLRDLHCNADGTACVCAKQDEKKKYPLGSSLLVFIENLAVPYLYGLSHYEQHGKWPWPDFSHGPLGLLEYCADDNQEHTIEDVTEILAVIRRDPNWKGYHKQLRKPSPERLCVCNSRIPFHKCHSRAWRGLLRLHAELMRLNLNLDNMDRISRIATTQ